MSPAKLKPLFGALFSHASTSGATPLHRMEYEVVALCNQHAVEHIERIIQQHLLHLPQGAKITCDAASSDGLLTRVGVRIWCAVPERAELVKLVSRLGLEKAVRSISWTGLRPRQEHHA